MNLSKKMHRLGLTGYMVRPIAGADPDDLPENIYISTAASPAEAFQDMFWAVHTPPYNIALWNPGPDVVPVSVRKDVAELCEARPQIFSHYRLNLPGHAPAQADFVLAAMGQTLRTARKHIQRPDDIRMMENWIKASAAVVDGIGSAFPATVIKPKFDQQNDLRARGNDELDLHVDGALIEGYHETGPEYPGLSRILHKGLRVVWAQNDAGTYVCDNADVDPDSIVVGTIGDSVYKTDFSMRNSTPILWEIPPWHIGLVSMSNWPHMPNVHSIPVRPGEALNRLFWDIEVSIEEVPPPESFQKWRKDHPDSLPPTGFEPCAA